MLYNQDKHFLAKKKKCVHLLVTVASFSIQLVLNGVHQYHNKFTVLRLTTYRYMYYNHNRWFYTCSHKSAAILTSTRFRMANTCSDQAKLKETVHQERWRTGEI